MKGVSGNPRKFQTERGNILRFDCLSLTIPPKSQGDLVLTLEAKRLESLSEYFEVAIKGSEDESLFFEVQAEV